MADPIPITSPSSIRSPSRSSRTNFLIIYNILSAGLWTVVLGRVVLLYLLRGPWKVYFGVGDFTKWTQTLAVSEILFSLTGLVRSPLITTLLQVSSRLFLVWPVVDAFPSSAFSRAYSSMLLAWSVTEVIRYTYFASVLVSSNSNDGRMGVPRWLKWLRYNTFFILYPLGIGSECYMILQTVGPAGQYWGKWAQWGFLAVLAMYVPGSYVLFTHMMKQRRKVMKEESGVKKVQ